VREFSVTLKDALASGISPEERPGVNAPYLRTLTGLRPSPHGLLPLSALSLPLSPAPTVSWPFPQLIRGAGVSLLMGATSAALVDESDWSYAPLTTYDAASPSTPKAIATGGPWHMADFGDSWILTNGAAILMQTRKNRIVAAADPVIVQDEVTFESVCAHRGRVIAGGPDPDSFWTPEMTAFWQGMIPAGRGWPPADLYMSANVVFWSGVGGGDWVWDVLRGGVSGAPALIGGTYTAASPAVLDRMKVLDWGYMPMPWQGGVKRVLPLGAAVIVYGAQGIAALVPDAQFGFGLKRLAPFGIAARSAAAGDDSGHVLLAEDGFLWRIAPDLTLARLGYQRELDPMLGSEIVIAHDAVEREFVISTGTLSYTLTPSGLAKTTPSLTSLERVAGGLAGVASSARSLAVQFETERLDFGFTAMKTLTGVEVEAVGISSIEVSFYWRAENTGGWTQSRWIPANPRGIVTFPVSGTEFRIAVRGTAEALTGTDGGGRVDRLICHYKSTDKRNIRGTYPAQ
jgi:hypothetical protein